MSQFRVLPLFSLIALACLAAQSGSAAPAVPITVELEGSPVERLRNFGSCRGCDLRGVDLKGAHLIGVDLRNADLRGASLEDANFEGADFSGARLQGANLKGA
ncbi:MAG: pentapeptide repeat-containing protein, partial [Prochlorococcus sp.]